VAQQERITLNGEEALTVAVHLHKAGRLQEAEEIYRALLKLWPEHADALHFLGILTHQLGRSAEGVDLIRKAVALAPEHAGAHNNLGNVFKEMGQYEQACDAYRTVLALDPNHADALNNLGIVLKRQGKLDESIAAYRRAIEARPDHGEAHHNLGNALRAAGRIEEAVEAYSRAAALRPGDPIVYRNLGCALYRAGRDDRAVQVIEEWLSLEPDNPFAKHLLAAFSGRDVPQRASDDYIRQLFEGFAENFDENLKDLGYRAPEMIASLLAIQMPPPEGVLDVLDGGCGTGLCAPHLRPYARRLVGVDLSEAMLRRARARGLYDELEVAELTSFLSGRPAAFDLIVVADTLVYFGLLGPVLAAASSALRPGGRLVLTVEKEEQAASAGFRLHPHGRYSHSEAYLREALEQAGLSIGRLETETLRMEAGDPVRGIVVTALKRAA
jgi:predicted TPR repeat methyltransferase